MNKSLENLHAVAIIADISESARQDWEKVVSTVNLILETLPEDAVENVSLLGSQSVLPTSYFTGGNIPRPLSGHSFIAPVMKQLQGERRRVQVALIVGTGEIFDLADWLHSPWVERWVLVDIGNSTLKPANLDVPVFNLSNLASLYTWLAGISPVKQVRKKPPTSAWSSGNYRWDLDKTGYPLIYIPPLKVYLHLFPVTKPQFEEFLIENPADFGDTWYQQLLALNSRLSYRMQNYTFYEQLLLTGIIPEEAVRFANWQGRAYRLLTVHSWRLAYQWLAQQGATPTPPYLQQQGLDESACEIWEGLYYQLEPHTLLDLSLMRQGVTEWVIEGDQYVGLGQTRPEFVPQYINPLVEFIPPIRPITRIRDFGFRLQRL